MSFKLLAFIVSVVLALFLSQVYEWDTFNPESIRGKRVLITGASSGIGVQLAYQYSKLGASVVITARREDLLQKVALKCKALGAAKVEYVLADMGRSEDRQRVVEVAEKHLGGLDHLILNHAILESGQWLGTADNMTKLWRQIEVNFVAYADIASKCLKMLTESKGNIGVVSSIAGKIAFATRAPYCAVKHALHGFFSSLRQELRLRGNDVSVTICILGAIRNDDSSDAPTMNYVYPAFTNETATAIVKGVVAKRYELHFPKQAWYLVNFHKFFPEYLESFIADATFNAS